MTPRPAESDRVFGRSGSGQIEAISSSTAVNGGVSRSRPVSWLPAIARRRALSRTS